MSEYYETSRYDSEGKQYPAESVNRQGRWVLDHIGEDGVAVYGLAEPTPYYFDVDVPEQFKQAQENLIAERITKHAHKAAIKELKQEGTLPPEYPDE